MYRYGGHVVAKLPFEPFTLLAKIAHRGLDSPAANDCSVVSDPLLPWQPCHHCALLLQSQLMLKIREVKLV